ncbi:hypothetical protein A0J61_11485 [Choanephora cucurbitarum]|uniref:Uncharacterized protein n=1 Tax=Choanephora cucurbitarum TaxID=101091 RepID=A0A1C7MVM1_9FUNG|nr:hypothetical protein A0J61_11485 [Choanephora cucurbitarum]
MLRKLQNRADVEDHKDRCQMSEWISVRPMIGPSVWVAQIHNLSVIRARDVKIGTSDDNARS